MMHESTYTVMSNFVSTCLCAVLLTRRGNEDIPHLNRALYLPRSALPPPLSPSFARALVRQGPVLIVTEPAADLTDELCSALAEVPGAEPVLLRTDEPTHRLDEA